MGRRAYIFAVLVAIASNDGNEPVSELLASDHRASIDVDLNTAFVVVAIDIVVVADVAYAASAAFGIVIAIRSSQSRCRTLYSTRAIGGCRLIYLPAIYDTLPIGVVGEGL